MRANSLVTPGHGMFAYEAEIMDAWDAGLSLDQIAAKLGMSASRVNNVVKTYAEGRADRWATPARLASMKLADALARL